ncbi:acylphosphatase-2 isoform X1 [Malurus melanocephalus]|uniref:acylphosphatase-2 isoform X1 n=1 Tax=Malurus melanocephalus TaxID=175006 RepID=UPI002549BDF1|nr:acylphosphatase-2 isoform X1 [Malurus melanocephalus]
MSTLAKASGALKSVDYEVFGRVQGVCFRMYTEQEAKKLGVVGWVKNTSKGTVTGQVQGPEEKVNAMRLIQYFKYNLLTQGHPTSLETFVVNKQGPFSDFFSEYGAKWTGLPFRLVSFC